MAKEKSRAHPTGEGAELNVWDADDQRPSGLQPSDNVRRVYALPQDLVERIVGFQKENRLPSEVEAVRRLLDDALKSRDTYATIAERFKAKLKEVPIMSDAVADVLARHPLVKSIAYLEDGQLEFELKNGHVVKFSKNATYIAYDRINGTRLADDEIPF